MAGCFGSSNVDGNTVVEQTVTDGEKKFEFDAEEGDGINMYVDRRDGPPAIAILHAPLGARATVEEIESEKTFSHTVQNGGVFVLEMWQDGGSNGEVYVEVGIES